MRFLYQQIVQNLSESTPQKWIDDDLWRLQHFYYGLYSETGSYCGPGLVMGAKSGLLALKWAIDYPNEPVFVVENDPILREAIEISAVKLNVFNIIVYSTVISFLKEAPLKHHRIERVWLDWVYFSEEILKEIVSNFRIGYIAGEFDEFQANPLWLHRLSRCCSRTYYWNNITHGLVISGKMSGPTDVSVVVYSPSSPKLLNDCLFSIVSQTLTKIEILVALSRAQIDLLDVVQDWEKRDCRVRALFSVTDNSGQSHATFLSSAVGYFIAFIDGNDLIDACMLQALAESAIAFTSDIAQCGFRDRNTDKENNDALEDIKFNKTIYEGNGLVDDPMSLISSRPTSWRRLFRRQFLIDHDIGTPDSFHSSGNLLFNFTTLALADRVSSIGSCFYNRLGSDFVNNNEPLVHAFHEMHLLKCFLRQHHSRKLEERFIAIQVSTYSSVLFKVDKDSYENFCLAVKYDIFEDAVSLPHGEVLRLIERDYPEQMAWANSIYYKNGSGIDAWALLLARDK
jgi:hypothetical protein